VLTCGVYAIEQISSGRFYVGSSHKIEARWSQHKTDLRGGYHANLFLQRAWSKNGPTDFKFLILVICAPEDRIAQEQIHIDQLNAFHKLGGFNLRPNAEGMAGFKFTPESVDKTKIANKKKADQAGSEEMKRRSQLAWTIEGRRQKAIETKARWDSGDLVADPKEMSRRAKLNRKNKGPVI
jgi:group I intron endonuclease